MEVILKQDIKGTGKAGDIVKVNDGFARNKLIPSGVAVEATTANKRAIEREKANLAEKIAADKAAANELKGKLEAAAVELKTKVGEGGKLFGSITSMDIAEAIKNQLGLDIDKKKIVLAKPIKEIGKTDVEVKLYEGIAATVAVEIKEI
ncbi:MAG: 50S ribosomal protein L9 [Clostridiales bacterium]|nr:50S ribosomal protein L9 [Candidatus Crickella equi]